MGTCTNGSLRMKKHLFEKLKRDMRQEGWNPKSITALLIFGAIVVVFVFFGYSGKHNRIGTGAAAQVNSTLISVADLRNETNRLEQMYAPMFGGQLQGETQRQFLRQQAVESLISTELMAQSARAAGVLATDREIRDVIVKDIPAFQSDGKFQRERYRGILEANHWTPGEFEGRVRKERETARLRRMMEAAATPLSLEVEKMKEMRELKRNVDFVKIDRAIVGEKMNVPAGEIEKRLADADFAKKVQEDFEKNKAQYGAEEKVHAQHILIKAESGSADSEKTALAKIQQIQKRLQKEDFGKVAAEVSEDAGSKAKKGDLGYFGKGQMVPQFEKAAFSLKVGSVSEPVKTDFGYHLIKVVDHKPAQEPKFEAARTQIAKKLIAHEKYEESVKKIEDALQAGDNATAEKLVKEMGLSWEESGFFELGQEIAPKLGSAVATQTALETSEKQPWPKKLARDGGALFLVKWKADKKEVAPDAGQMKDNLVRERSYDLLNQWLEEQKKTASIERNPEVVFGKQ